MNRGWCGGKRRRTVNDGLLQGSSVACWSFRHALRLLLRILQCLFRTLAPLRAA